jgi:uncharacterized protein YgiM (DUF1202 family)
MQVLLLPALLLTALVAQAAARTCVCGATSGGGQVNVRSCATTSCAVVGSLNPGQCADWQANHDASWYRITYSGSTAYVHRDHTSAPHECGGGSYCTNNLCSSFSSNQKRACDSYGCGNYGASRTGGVHGGWDVRCNAGATVYAPYAGTVTRRAYPYGTGSCCDIGFEISGNGQFAGHVAMIFYCDPNRVTIPSAVTKGQAVATHRGLHCGCYNTGMTDHVHYQVLYNGVRIDPASFLFC